MRDYLSRLKARISRTPSKPPASKPDPALFQFMSDLHLEVGHQYASFDFPATAPYLILGGDIGRLIDYDAYLEFLSRRVARYERVFLVLGNHEFHGMDFDSGVSTARKLEGEDVLGGKLCLLHGGREELLDGKVIVLGCPLWSMIPDQFADVVRPRVKDFQKITDWSVQRHNEAHEADLQWLRGEVNSLSHDSGKVVVVVTHHAPSIQETSRPAQVNGPQTCAFATDLLSEGDWGPVDYWVYGHTHYGNDFEKNGVKVVSNQRGYILPGTSVPVGGEWDPGKQEFDTEKAICITIDVFWLSWSSEVLGAGSPTTVLDAKPTHLPHGPKSNIPRQAKDPLSDEVAHADDKVKIVSTHVPMGVVGALVARNSPITLVCLKTASALITGNCVIVKPSPLAPYATLKLVELCRDVAPRGVIQILNGGADVGSAMKLFGPLVNRQHFEIVKGFLENGKKNKHRIVTGGKVCEKGLWIEPTVVVKPPGESRLVKEEQFGGGEIGRQGLMEYVYTKSLHFSKV